MASAVADIRPDTTQHKAHRAAGRKQKRRFHATTEMSSKDTRKARKREPHTAEFGLAKPDEEALSDEKESTQRKQCHDQQNILLSFGCLPNAPAVR